MCVLIFTTFSGYARKVYMMCRHPIPKCKLIVLFSFSQLHAISHNPLNNSPRHVQPSTLESMFESEYFSVAKRNAIKISDNRGP